MIRGELTTLRAVEPGDLRFLMDLENDLDNWLVSGTLQPFSSSTLQKYVEGVHDVVADKQLRLIIMVGDQPVGCIDLFEVDWVHRRAGVGIIVISSQRGEGYAFDALQAASSYARQTLNMQQLFCNIMPQNKVSIALFEKAGFVKTGEKKQWIQLPDGDRSDEWMYQLIFS